MKFTAAFILFASLHVSAKTWSQQVTLAEKNAKIEKIFSAIKVQTGYVFFYDQSLIGKASRVSINVRNASLKEALDLSFQNQPLTYSIVGKTIVVKSKPPVVAEEEQMEVPQGIDVTGVVTNESGEPLVGASVVVKGSKLGTVTDRDGRFLLKQVDEGATLVISFLGYATQEVRVVAGKTHSIQLKQAADVLNETVVIGYGKVRAKDLTGAVSSLSRKDIEDAPMGSSIQSLLQGKASGVNVLIQSASPTSPISVTVRGVSTLSSSGTQPLWVIDGVPDYSINTSGDIDNALFNLNISDIESIDILKDASATAIYGSRGANGVVIVTTRRGSKRMAPTVELNMKYGVQTLNSNKLKTFNAEEYRHFAETLGRQYIDVLGRFNYTERMFFDEQKFLQLNTSQWTPDMLELLPNAFYDGNTNWWDELTQNAKTDQVNLSIRGGNEVTNYFFSFGRTDMDGVVKGGYNTLYSGRMNFETQIGKVLNAGVLFSASKRDANNKDDIMRSLPRFRPDMPAYNDDGSINIVPGNTTIENPLLTLQNRNLGNGKSLNGTLFLELDVTKDLKLKTSGNVSYSNSTSDFFNKKGTQGYNSAYNWRRLSNYENSTTVWENTLNYVKPFGNHHVSAVLGQSYEHYNRKSMLAVGEGFPDEDVLININSAATTSGSSSEFSNSLVSVFARANYKFLERYLATFTVRADGSSKFGPNNRWGYFPSGALAWVISEENFMSGLRETIPYLKLRASAGKSGTQNLGNYDWMTTYDAAPYNGEPGIRPSSLGNPSLMWETAVSTDLGIDFALLNQRLRGGIGYYSKNVDNLIYLGSVPTSSSFQTINQNVGSITNKGWEFQLEGDVIRNQGTILKLGFNIATNQGKVNKLDGIQKELVMPYYYEWVKLQEGGKLGDWYGYQSAGRHFATAEEIYILKGKNSTYRTANEGPGDPYIIDQNGDGKITKLDKVVLGNFNPKFYGGFNMGFTYKDLNVSTVFSYSYGAERLWNYPYSAVTAGAQILNGYNYLMDSWNFTQDPSATLPRMGLTATYNGLSNFFIYDASFIRLNALNVSYRIPVDKLAQKFISRAAVNFQAANLFTITKYPGFDPQGNFGSTNMALNYTVGARTSQELIGVGSGVDYGVYPSSKTYTVGLTFTFK
ncbi:MAG: TonB-dependent receptor [Flavisolibacter sp.]